MKIWYVRDGEPLPTDKEASRLMRGGMLCQQLTQAGNEVTWFSSSFDHYRKRQRKVKDREELFYGQLKIIVLKVPGYCGNISLARIINHKLFARSFLAAAKREKTLPDVIVTDLPTTDTAHAVVRFAREHNIPTVVSIRDKWPDFFVDFVPAVLKPFVRMGTIMFNRQAIFVCRHATSLVGSSQGNLDWALKKADRPNGPLDQVFPLGYKSHRPPFSSASTAKLTSRGLDFDKHIVVFSGTWNHTHNLNILVEIASLLECESNIQMVVSGAPTQPSSVQEKLKTKKNVVLTGWLNPEETAVMLSNAQIGLLPYDTLAPQTLPNKVFEYLAYGLYQIAILSKNTDTCTLYQQNQFGTCIPNGSAPELVHEILKVLNNPSLLAAKAERRGYFETHYHADQIYQAMTKHIEQVSQSHSPVRGPK